MRCVGAAQAVCVCLLMAVNVVACVAKGTLSGTEQETIYIVYYFSGSFLMFVFEIGCAVGLLLLWLIGLIRS